VTKRRARGRLLDGLLLLDKPSGISSNAALQRTKSIYFAKKAGHTGSLDPLATGMLPICFGEVTKFSQFLLDADKHYQVVAQLGVRTDTGDSEGEVIATEKTTHIDVEAIENVLTNFRGTIKQVPSMFSALKSQGVPLYKLARQGIEVQRQPRSVTIRQLSLLDFNQVNATLSLDVKCSKGTYVRNLVDDIGIALGCGAHVIALRRLRVGEFAAADMVTQLQLEALRNEKAFAQLDALLLPLYRIFQKLPQINLTAAAAFRLRQGQVIDERVDVTAGLVTLYDTKDGFIGIGVVKDDGSLAAKRLLKA